MRVFAILLGLSATLSAQPRPVIVTGSVATPAGQPCDDTPREVYWANMTNATITLVSVRLQQRVYSGGDTIRPASSDPVAVDLMGRVLISHPGVDVGPKTLLAGIWTPDTEPTDHHDLTADISGSYLRPGEWLTLWTACHWITGFNVQHDATLTLSYVSTP